jgi:hypothetical protein
MKSEHISLPDNSAQYIYLPGLSLGTTFQIKFEGLGTAQTNLIGMNAGKFLICERPPISDIWSKLYQKNHAIVRYIFTGRIYSFSCTLLELIKNPYRLSILSYPETVEVINLREHERISCNINAEVTVGNRLHEGIIANISWRGCSFEVERTDENLPQLRVNEEILIAIHFKESAKPTFFRTIVRWVNMDSLRIKSGLQFSKSDITEQDKASEKDLKDYLLIQLNS